MCELDVVEYLLSLVEKLKQAYWLYQSLLEASKENNIEKFREVVKDNLKKVNDYMQTTLKTLNKNLEYVLLQNTFKWLFRR